MSTELKFIFLGISCLIMIVSAATDDLLLAIAGMILSVFWLWQLWADS